MACRLSLPIWPTSLNCVSWSDDNFIAVGGGEHIAILTPRLKDPGPDGTYWDTTVFKANEFTVKDVPVSDPLSFRNFSPGEELSLRHVHALEWSPQGLSRFGRCALAVLSSNHLLSIWEYEGMPNVDGNWKRKAIVNDAIRTHYADLCNGDSGTQQDQRERQRVQQRIRTFAWCTKARGPRQDEQQSTNPLGRHDQILVVSTEAADILLLRVQSPHDILNPTATEWSFEVIQSISTRAPTVAGPHFDDDSFRNPADMDSRGSESRTAEHLATELLEQKGSDERRYARLAYISNRRLFYLEVEIKSLSNSTRQTISPGKLISGRSDMTGPLKFIAHTSLLISFAADKVFCFDTSTNRNANGNTTSHHLDGRWDEITGLAICDKGQGLPDVHFTSHLSSATANTTTLPLPVSEDAVSVTPSWQRALKEAKAAFSSQHSLAGYVTERVWGIASSPLAEYIATASIMLPSDSLAYVTPAEQRTVLNITLESDLEEFALFREDNIRRSGFDVTAETLLFSLQRHPRRQPTSVDSEQLIEVIVKATTVNRELFIPISRILSAEETVLADIVNYLRQEVIFNPDLSRHRIQLLIDVACRKALNSSQVSKPVIERLVDTVLEISSGLSQGGEISATIRRIYKVVKAKLKPEKQTNGVNSATEDWSEACLICGKTVLFESVKWARCASGHEFARCALTFFAIQEPSIAIETERDEENVLEC